jgi:hypothetical protein
MPMPFAMRAMLLNLIEMNLQRPDDLALLRRHRECLLDATSDAQSARQMASIISYEMSVERLIPPGVDISDTAVTAISRRLTRISNATFFASQEFDDESWQIEVAA